MSQNLTVHIAMYADLPEIAEIHVRVWQQAYRGQMPQDVLDGLDPVARLRSWQEAFTENKDDERFDILLARISGRAVGFLSYGPARDDDRGGGTEVYAIYVLEDCWSKGIGCALFTTLANKLKEKGEKQTYLWVLDTNQKALKAYRKWGGIVENTRIKSISIGGQPLKEISVLFNLF